MTDDAILADVIGDLESMDLIRHSEVCYGKVLRTKYGYVIQDDNQRKHLKKAKDYFEGIGIPLCGRVAEFEYINMDVCIERGCKLADRLNREAQVPTPTVEAAV
jgi:protoporphyrinogen oxidase